MGANPLPVCNRKYVTELTKRSTRQGGAAPPLKSPRLGEVGGWREESGPPMMERPIIPSIRRSAVNSFVEHHQESIQLQYSCFDRILLNAIIEPLQQPPIIVGFLDRKSTRLNSSHIQKSRMPSSA